MGPEEEYKPREYVLFPAMGKIELMNLEGKRKTYMRREKVKGRGATSHWEKRLGPAVSLCLSDESDGTGYGSKKTSVRRQKTSRKKPEPVGKEKHPSTKVCLREVGGKGSKDESAKDYFLPGGNGKIIQKEQITCRKGDKENQAIIERSLIISQ